MRTAIWRIGVPLAALLCGGLVGEPALFIAFMAVPLGELIGYAVGTTSAGLAAFLVGQFSAPDHTRGRLPTILIFSVGSVVLSVPVGAALGGAQIGGGPRLYLDVFVLVVASACATFATWRYRKPRDTSGPGEGL